MIKVTRTFRRPSADIPFYHEIQSENKSTQAHMYKNYILTKKFVSSNHIMSEDKLEFTSYTIWSTEDDFFDFVTDVDFAKLIDNESSKRHKYEDDNNIIVNINVENVGA
jgi:hypothetical protein